MLQKQTLNTPKTFIPDHQHIVCLLAKF